MKIPFHKITEIIEKDETARREINIFAKKIFVFLNLFLYFIFGVLVLFRIFGLV